MLKMLKMYMIRIVSGDILPTIIVPLDFHQIQIWLILNFYVNPIAPANNTLSGSFFKKKQWNIYNLSLHSTKYVPQTCLKKKKKKNKNKKPTCTHKSVSCKIIYKVNICDFEKIAIKFKWHWWRLTKQVGKYGIGSPEKNPYTLCHFCLMYICGL